MSEMTVPGHLWLSKSEPVSVVGQGFRYSGQNSFLISPRLPELMLMEAGSPKVQIKSYIYSCILCTYTHGQTTDLSSLAQWSQSGGPNPSLRSSTYLTFMEGLLCAREGLRQLALTDTSHSENHTLSHTLTWSHLHLHPARLRSCTFLTIAQPHPQSPHRHGTMEGSSTGAET